MYSHVSQNELLNSKKVPLLIQELYYLVLVLLRIIKIRPAYRIYGQNVPLRSILNPIGYSTD